MKEIVYKVKLGDDIEKVAKMFNVDKKMIYPQKIERGDRIVVNLQKTTCYIVMPGDTIESISKKLNIDQSFLKKQKFEPLFIGKQLIIKYY